MAFVMGVTLTPWFSLPKSVLVLLIVLSLALAALSKTRPPIWATCLLLGMLDCASITTGPRLQGTVTVQGIIVGAPRGRTADLMVEEHIAPGEGWQQANGRLRLVFPERPPPPGTPLVARGEARPLGEGSLPGSPDSVNDGRRAGIETKLVVRNYQVLNGKTRSARRLHTEVLHGGVLLALATGDCSAVDEEVLTLLRRTGTAHLLAISGFHVGVIGGLFFGVTTVLLRPFALVRRTGLPTWPPWVAAVVGAVLYAWAAGAPISAQRAAGVMVLVAIAAIMGRRTAPLRLLATAAVAILLIDPSAIATPSFQLSFGAMLGLLRLTPRLVRYLPPDTTWCLRWTARSLAATVGATAGTLPASAWWFQQLPPLSPIANLVAMPLTAIVIAPCATAATYGPESISTWFAALGNLAIELLVMLLTPMSIEPWHPAVGPWGALGLATILLVPKRPFVWLPAALMALLLKQVPASGTRVTFFDVGQGDSALVEYDDGCRWLIDGGPPNRAVLQHLRRLGITGLDLVVASHGQMDHIGGLHPVLEELRVERLVIPELEGTESLREIAAARGIDLLLDGHTLHHSNTNDRSLVLETHRGGVLFTGDIQKDREQSDEFPQSAVLKVPHHGSSTSSTRALLDSTQPRVAIISAGRHNRFGHPNPEVLRRYLQQGIQVYRTDRQGNIQVHLRDKKLFVRTYRAGAGWSDEERFALLGTPGLPGTIKEDGQSPKGHNGRYPLRIGQHLTKEGGQEMAAAGIAPKHFDDASTKGIEHQIEEHHLTIEAFARIEPAQEPRNAKKQGRFVELGRVEGHVGWPGTQRIGEDYSQWRIGGLAVATASGKTPQPGDSVP